MKLIGLLGGTSWPSTVEYYRKLNTSVGEQLGGRHSANIVLRSVDFHEMRTRYDDEKGRDEIPSILRQHMEELISYRPACIIICNNALHQFYDKIKSELPNGIPVIHIVDETAKFIKEKSYKSVLLLSTKLVMEDGYYSNKLIDKGINVVIPDASERDNIQRIQTIIATRNTVPEEDRKFFLKLLEKYKPRCDAAVLACTELPLVFKDNKQTSIPIIDPGAIQCEKALEFALGAEAEYSAPDTRHHESESAVSRLSRNAPHTPISRY